MAASASDAEHARAVAKAVCLYGRIGGAAAERNRVRFFRADLVTCVCELASGTRQSSRLLSDSAQTLRRWVTTALPPGEWFHIDALAQVLPKLQLPTLTHAQWQILDEKASTV